MKIRKVNESEVDKLTVGDMVLYDGKYVAKVTQLHKNYELVTIKIYHTTGLLQTTSTTISTIYCEKFPEENVT